MLLGSEADKKKQGEMFSTYSVHWLFCDSHIIHHRKTLSAINISPSLVAALTKNKAININADKYKANNDIPNCFCVNLLCQPSILPDWLRRNREGFPGGAVVKNPPANVGDMGSSPGLGRSHMLWSN